jgi:hypothetical protein
MLALVTFDESEDDEVPYSTREFDPSLVVHLTMADVLPGVGVTDEITGGVVSTMGAGETDTAVLFVEPRALAVICTEVAEFAEFT